MMQRQRVAELVQNWAVWRDAGDWERFRTCWHEDGFMMATWCQAPAADFIVSGPAQHGVAGLVNLFGIESPGLTAAIVLGEHVAAVLKDSAA